MKTGSSPQAFAPLERIKKGFDHRARSSVWDFNCKCEKLLTLVEQRILKSMQIDERAREGLFSVLRVGLFALMITIIGGGPAFAADPMAPSEIQSTFFTGQPFTAMTLSGAKYKMTFTADGKMTREPVEQASSGSAGTWKLSAKGFCTSWNHSAPNCFTIIPSSENKWSVQKLETTIATTVAIWSK